MTSRVYRLHSTLELPLEDVYDHFEDPDLPAEIEDVDITRRNNTLILSAVATDGEISKYTPTAQLKASVTENRVYEEEPEPPHGGSGGGQWGALTEEEEEEIESELVEYACFKGDRETVLQNTSVQFPMFKVLCDIAEIAEKGTLTAIIAIDDTLEAVQIVDGERRPASIGVTEDPADDQGEDGVDWRDNDFIA
ncbi:hypothetical protein Hrd1104_08070 [Halorhabdus sp. CBA1104]|jgi:hypothetical protein|uniref:DUF7110 family protein n=1 Tax=Halorhabdus sp. CBA1104 TaxID=1380432 RepID=UPI0012B36F1C|nr:hypothetical protein [Halorhabdus sp. CBA1104]QGN08225.1 hypothetical protein Hrd1104_08070 [Halorhabdus sp. CBA1104]